MVYLKLKGRKKKSGGPHAAMSAIKCLPLYSPSLRAAGCNVSSESNNCRRLDLISETCRQLGMTDLLLLVAVVVVVGNPCTLAEK